MSDLQSLFPALSRLIDSAGEGTLKLSVSLTDSAEVQLLKGQVSDLQSELDSLRELYNRTEYLYRCEVLVNMELLDLCKLHKIPVRRSMFDRPRE